MSSSTPSRKDAQKLGFDTYLLIPQKRANSAPILCGSESDSLKNVIQLGRHTLEVPLQWSDGQLTATQIVEGKIARRVMRSQKLVLCQVEEDQRKWFEVSVLNDDLSYKFGQRWIGLRVFPFEEYAPAKRYFRKLILNAEKQGGENGAY